MDFYGLWNKRVSSSIPVVFMFNLNGDHEEWSVGFAEL